MPLSAIILAAGKSTRMKSRRPKPLHEICGRPMLHYVLQACYDAGCQQVMVVIGHGKEEIISRFESDDRIKWIEQTEQLGTGHAARACESELVKHSGNVFILAGDGPLIRGQVLRTLLHAHQDERADASMATAVLDDPTGYGRIIRDDEGNFLDIVEEVDCTPAQREIHEVFPSYYCLKSEALLDALGKLTNDNKKHEYYLTDVYGHLRRDGKKVVAVQAVAAGDVLAVNTREQQAQVDAIVQERIQRRTREEGVAVVSPTNTYIEDGANIGADTIVHPFAFIGRDSSIGRDCIIGPFACLPADSIVPDGATIAGNAYADNMPSPLPETQTKQGGRKR